MFDQRLWRAAGQALDPVFGFLDRRKAAEKKDLPALALATIVAVVAQDKAYFWAAGIMVGFFAGPNQSASRSLLGRFVPRDKKNQFFGFFAFSGKLTAFFGPMFLGVLPQAVGSQRAGMAEVGLDVKYMGARDVREYDGESMPEKIVFLGSLGAFKKAARILPESTLHWETPDGGTWEELTIIRNGIAGRVKPFASR